MSRPDPYSFPANTGETRVHKFPDHEFPRCVNDDPRVGLLVVAVATSWEKVQQGVRSHFREHRCLQLQWSLLPSHYPRGLVSTDRKGSSIVSILVGEWGWSQNQHLSLLSRQSKSYVRHLTNSARKQESDENVFLCWLVCQNLDPWRCITLLHVWTFEMTP